MIPRECKRLAEVDFPIAVVSKHAAREKSIRHGHPSTLHLWWARRLLASCRAMLLALLLPDPCDPYCPDDFKAKARDILAPVPGDVGASDEDLRRALLNFIGNFANWDHAANPTFLKAGRGLVKAAHPDETPLVVDPFAGGGSIPLEALRLGCDAFASDLNPVAGLILKVLLEDIPRYGPGLADELRRVGAKIKAATEKELAHFYPPDPDGAKPIAYLWARTVRCEAPNCGVEIPLIRSFWLCKKPRRRRALRAHVQSTQPPTICFEVFEPAGEHDVPDGTVVRGRATCIACNAVLSPDRVRAQLSAQRGGANVRFNDQKQRSGGARLLAVVTLDREATGRQYRVGNETDLEPLAQAQEAIEYQIHSSLANDALFGVPTEPVLQSRVAKNSPFRFHLYGCNTFGGLCTNRQQLALLTFSKLIREAGVSQEVRKLLGLTLDRVASRSSSLCSWRYQADQEKVEHMFVRQALSLEWDFAEAVPLSESTGSFQDAVETVALSIASIAHSVEQVGQVMQADAANLPLPDEVASVWFTDPPYYDAVPYSDLSDYFFIWLKRALPEICFPSDADDPANPLTPKRREIRMDEARDIDGAPKDKVFFEKQITKSFSESRRILTDDGIGSVIFAHKTTEGWEALLSGLIESGWTVTGSWPIATEMSTRLRARMSAALATSIHLVCRPRREDAGVGDWANILAELPERVGEWMVRLDREGVRGADLVFACIGPALEIFSRYARVETAEGREVPLAEYLEKVWEVVGRAALHQVLGTAEAQARNGGAGALEEDARLTALFLWTIRSTAGDGAGESGAEEDEEEADDAEEEDSGGRKAAKGFTLIYDIARRFAQPLGIHLQTWEGRIIETEKGVVRLLPVTERARQLFGGEGATGLADRIDRAPAVARQLDLFPEAPEPEMARPRAQRRRFVAASAAAPREATTLDRVHTAMLLQVSGRSNALRTLLAAEQERGPDFLRLGNALSALYPQGSEEKRLLDAMLLAVPK